MEGVPVCNVVRKSSDQAAALALPRTSHTHATESSRARPLAYLTSQASELVSADILVGDASETTSAVVDFSVFVMVTDGCKIAYRNITWYPFRQY